MDWKEHSYKYKIVAWSGNRWDIQVLICVFFCRGFQRREINRCCGSNGDDGFGGKWGQPFFSVSDCTCFKR